MRKAIAMLLVIIVVAWAVAVSGCTGKAAGKNNTSSSGRPIIFPVHHLNDDDEPHGAPEEPHEVPEEPHEVPVEP